MNNYDKLIEQQDQEFAQTGEVSPFTHRQLEALANGEPIPHVYNAPAVIAATKRLLRGQNEVEDEENDLWT